MPLKNYQLANGGKQLSISWRGIWRDVEIRVDERVLGTLDGLSELQRGAEFELPDGAGTLSVRISSGLGAYIEVLQNGEPVVGSDGHPETQVASAVGVVFIVALLNVLLGAFAIAGVTFLVEMGFGVFSVCFGVLMGALGAIVRLKRSTVALSLATALFVLDAVAGAWMSVSHGGELPIAQLGVRAFLIAIMCVGVRAIGKLNSAPP